ncbi:MAG: amidohydrolase family protein [Hyphomicrobiales bacterium]|jgi:predicted TIM-barrel fold metal-dependent hydrolase
MLTICDPHIHLWDLSTGLYPGFEEPSDSFIGNNAAIARSYLLDEYLQEADPEVIEIIGAVHVEAFPTDPLREVEVLQAVAVHSPVPLGIVGHADLTSASIGGLLDAMMEHAAFRGIRHVVNLHDDPAFTYVQEDFLADPTFERGFAELCKRGLSFDLQLYPHQADAAAKLLQRFADTKVVVNHAAMWVDRTPDGWARWKRALRTLAALPHVRVKVSGLGMFDRSFTAESLRPLIYETLEAFGVERCMFASNFPVDKLFSDFTTLWGQFDAISQGLSAEERALLFHRNAMAFYKL